MTETRKKRVTMAESNFIKAGEVEKKPVESLADIVEAGEDPTAKKRITADLDLALHKRLKKAAVDMGVSQTEIVRQLLERFLPL